MDGLAIVLNEWFADFPLLARAFFTTLELCVLVPLLALAVKLQIVRTYRLQSLLWLFLLLNVIAGLLVAAPYGVSFAPKNRPAPAPVTVAPDNVFRPVLRDGMRSDLGVDNIRPETRDVRTVIGAPPGLTPSIPIHMAVPTWWRTPTATEIIGLVWLGGVLLMGGYLGLERVRLWRLLQRTVAPGPALKDQYETEAAARKTWWRPSLRVTNDLETPAIVGVLRPVILVPRWLEAEGSREQWSWTLRHELTHWHHGDTLGQLIRLVTQALFFFHPLVWWAGRRWEEAAELACDRSLLQTDRDAVGYARELCELLGMIGKRQRPLMSTGLFASRSHIGRRIETLLANPLARPAHLGVMQRVVALVVLVSLLAVGFGSAVTPLAPVVPAVSLAATTPKAAPPDSASGRVLHFPEGYSMGTLRIGGESVDARGAVVVPDGASVYLRVNDAGAADLSPLAAFGPNDLQELSLTETAVQDDQFIHLQGLTGLGRLELRETLITDEGMQYLAGMTQLHRLNLNGTAVTDEGMRYLSDMSQMESLILNRTQVGDEGLSYLRDMTALTELDLWMLDITDEGMQYLAGMESLYELGIEDTLITDDGLQYLEGLTRLFQINLENNNITDAGLLSLAKIPNLARIGLADTYITDAGMEILAQFPSLQAAILPVQIGPEGLKYLEGTAVWNYIMAEVGELRPVTVSITGAGRPLPDARFFLAEDAGERDKEIHFFRTGPTGDARIYLPRKSVSYQLRAYAEGYVTNEASWADPAPAVLRLNLEPAAHIGGVVVDERGGVVEGVAVSIPVLGGHNWDAPDPLPHSVLTDHEGRWSSDVAPRKLVDFWVSLDHRDYATTTYTMADLPLGSLQAGTAVLAIADPIGLPGFVVDETGAPIPEVQLMEMESWRQYGIRATGRKGLTDASGYFEIRPIRPGDTVLKISAAGYVVQSQTVHVTADMAPVQFTLKPTAILRGRALDRDGVPLKGLQVGVFAALSGGVRPGSWWGTTDQEGRFVWPEAPDGNLNLLFIRDAERHEVPAVQVTKGEQVFELPFQTPMEAIGITEGQALLERFQWEHSLERVGNVAFGIRQSQGVSANGATNTYTYHGILANDGRYRETVDIARDSLRDTRPWRYSWNGHVAVRNDGEWENGSQEGENLFVIDTVARDWADSSMANLLQLFVPAGPTAPKLDVIQFEEGVLSQGIAGVVRVKIYFVDVESLTYDRIEYMDDDGQIQTQVEITEWFPFNTIQFPAEARIDALPSGQSLKLSVAPFERVDVQEEDFVWAIPYEHGVRIQNGVAENSVDVLRLDEKLVGEKKYLEALAAHEATR